MEDAELVKKMISGDMDAFDRLMEQYQAEALRAAYLISGNHADSEDIVQETFVSCYLNRSQIKNPEAFRSWFYESLSLGFADQVVIVYLSDHSLKMEAPVKFCAFVNRLSSCFPASPILHVLLLLCFCCVYLTVSAGI